MRLSAFDDDPIVNIKIRKMKNEWQQSSSVSGGLAAMGERQELVAATLAPFFSLVP